MPVSGVTGSPCTASRSQSEGVQTEGQRLQDLRVLRLDLRQILLGREILLLL
jgi:hypothetical protein